MLHSFVVTKLQNSGDRLHWLVVASTVSLSTDPELPKSGSGVADVSIQNNICMNPESMFRSRVPKVTIYLGFAFITIFHIIKLIIKLIKL